MHADFLKFDVAGVAANPGVEIRFNVNMPDGPVRVLESPRAWVLVEVNTVTGYIRSDGRMWDRRAVSAAPFDLDDPGNLGVRLLANDSDFQIATPITYRVTVSRMQDGRAIPVMIWNTPAAPSTDTAVNLADYAPAPTTF